jgi:peptide deformylase
VAVLPIRIFGDPVLRARASEVIDFDDVLRKLAGDMMETMRDAQGAGLAANQVGVLKRLFTWQSAEDEHGTFVNPVLLEASEEVQEGDEGCLSFPGLWYPTKRPLRVRMAIRNVHGEEHVVEGSELQARIFMHELDHLNGILFIDHLARHDRKEAMRRIRAGELERPHIHSESDPPAA